MTGVLRGIGLAWLSSVLWAVVVVFVAAYPALDAQWRDAHPQPVHHAEPYAFWQVLDCTGHCK